MLPNVCRHFLSALLLLLAAGCNIGRPAATPSPTAEWQRLATSEFATATAIPPPLPTAAAASPTVQVATAAPTATEPPPSPSATPTATSIYIEYVVQEDETLFYILQLPQHGYGYEPAVAATVVALNDNIPNADSLRGGISILIPRPTATFTEVGIEATKELLATIGADDSSGAVLPAGAVVGCHDVLAGDSMVSIAVQYRITLEILSDLNRDVNWSGCNFTQPSGGPECRPTLRIGQCIRVPAPTPLPTKFPTPSGAETATPTATKLAPRLLYPPDGAVLPPAPLTLLWVGLSGMSADDEYLIELVDQTTNQSLRQVTRANSYRVPQAFIPADGQTHTLQWRVIVARQFENGVYQYVGAEGDWPTFQWRSA